MTEWSDISTAPKDGSSILCAAPLGNGEVRIAILRWDWGPSRTACWRTDVYAFVPFEPTHWMPLPEPPKPEGS